MYPIITRSILFRTVPNTEYTNYSGTIDARLTLLKTIRLASDISYATNNGLSAGYNQNTTIWNGNITKDFFKDKRAQIKVQVYDILGQNKSIRRNTSQNYIEDVQSKVLTRYFMVSLVYNFNKFLANQRQPEEGRGAPGMMPPRMRGGGPGGPGGPGGGGPMF